MLWQVRLRHFEQLRAGKQIEKADRIDPRRDLAFAVVITDLGMPYVDGRQVASAIKNLSSSTPVILLTGWGQRLLAEGDVPAHVDRVLSKPPKLSQLRDALRVTVHPMEIWAEDGLAKIHIVDDLCVEIEMICSGCKVRSQWALDDRVFYGLVFNCSSRSANCGAWLGRCPGHAAVRRDPRHC
jgi:CheY-like chemotaxis protein